MIVDYNSYRIRPNQDNFVEQLVSVLLLPDLVLSMIEALGPIRMGSPRKSAVCLLRRHHGNA